MKKLLCLVALTSIFPNLLAAEPVGTIYIADGSKIRFYEILEIEAWTEAGGAWQYFTSGAWTVDYKGTTTDIPYEKLKSVEISAIRCNEDHKVDANVKIVTATGATVTCKQALNHIKIRMYNELTGEIKIQQVDFQRNEKLNIVKITMDD